jgi:hypothetical protein
MSGRACGRKGCVASRRLAAAVVAGSLIVALSGVAHAHPGDDRNCQATAGAPDVEAQTADTEVPGNGANCGPGAPSPIVLVPPPPVLAIP